MRMHERTLRRRIEEANKAYDLFQSDARLLVALSGGADSVALLLALTKMLSANQIVACHVNHRLRGAEAERDARFCRSLCERLSVPFELCEADVAEIAVREKISTELAARHVRYAFFETVCHKYALTHVATAHTASDNAETVLFNLTRGTALSGLAGIPPKRALGEDIILVRPLLLCTRDQIEAFLEEVGETFVTDSTNLTDVYTRNFYRHKILPLLKQINPSIEEGLSGMCKAVRDAQIFIEKTANNNLTEDVHRLAALDEPILCECILRLYHHSFSDTPENVHIRATAALIRSCANSKQNAEFCYPGGMSAYIRDGVLSFSKTVRREKIEEKPYELPLCEGFFMIEHTPFAVEYTPDYTGNEHHEGFLLYDSVFIDPDLFEGVPCLRSRRAGDTLYNGGMTRKLKELFNKKKIPPELRRCVPLLCDTQGERVLFAPRVATSDCVRDAFRSSRSLWRVAVYISEAFPYI